MTNNVKELAAKFLQSGYDDLRMQDLERRHGKQTEQILNLQTVIHKIDSLKPDSSNPGYG